MIKFISSHCNVLNLVLSELIDSSTFFDNFEKF